MVWIPDLYVMISPCQVNVDVEYILGIVGMMLYSLSKSNLSSTSTSYCPMKHSNTPLQFVTQGQSQASFMYLEKLYIAPVYFDMEIDIKDETQEAEEGALTLDTIARSTTSSAAAGILTWIVRYYVCFDFQLVFFIVSSSLSQITDKCCSKLRSCLAVLQVFRHILC